MLYITSWLSKEIIRDNSSRKESLHEESFHDEAYVKKFMYGSLREERSREES